MCHGQAREPPRLRHPDVAEVGGAPRTPRTFTVLTVLGLSVHWDGMRNAKGREGREFFFFLPSRSPLPSPSEPRTKPGGLPSLSLCVAARRPRVTALPASPGPLHCLFCCQRTYQDVSLLEVLTCPGALVARPGPSALFLHLHKLHRTPLSDL